MPGLLAPLSWFRSLVGSEIPMRKLITEKQAVELYGDPGRKRVAADPAWEKARITYCGGAGKAAHPVMPGVPPRYWFAVHELVEPRMCAGFTAAKAACPTYEIERAGCYVYRHQRHDPARPLSLHSWGIAVDVDADRNSARQFARGKQPKPWSPEWLAIWPEGLPEAWVRAFCQAGGFDWGVDWTGFLDPMHLQIRAP